MLNEIKANTTLGSVFCRVDFFGGLSIRRQHMSGHGLCFFNGSNRGNHSGNDGISSNVEGCSETIHEPVNGKNVRESFGDSFGSEHGVVSGNDQNQTGRRNGGGSGTSNGRDKYPTLEKASLRSLCDPTALIIKDQTAKGVIMMIQLIKTRKTASSSRKRSMTAAPAVFLWS